MIKAIQRRLESNHCPKDKGNVYDLVASEFRDKNELERCPQ